MRTAAAERRAILFWETDPRFKSPVVSHAAGTELGGLNPKEGGGTGILFLKHGSSILSLSHPTQVVVQGRAKPVLHGPNSTNHMQGWMNVRESYSRDLGQGTLGRRKSLVRKDSSCV